MDIRKTQSGDYKRKIKTREELAEILGPRPRKKSVIMCHGTFDIVHPGHIRHLMYASEKADILVVSLTCDAHIAKANFRPFVPEELRAMNLAALEIVDYVIIDKNPKPIENLLFLKPDYFAKGYEYTSEGLDPRTKEELDALDTFGGEAIFSPGDVVYSSSLIIDHDPPKMAGEKLKLLMESEGITFKDLRDAVHKLKDAKVHVVGDTIVDSYIYTTMIGGGSKTPTFSVKYEQQVDYTGGAAIVAKHLRAAGARVRFSTVMGNDALKDFVVQDLEKAGVECVPIVDRTRPTTQKAAYICKGYRLLKVDKLDNRGISDKIVAKLAAEMKESKDFDAIVFSDFRHGIFSKNTIPKLTDAIPKGPLKVADSQVASRWGNILDFVGFDLITPNEREARFALGDQDLVVRPLALEIYKRARCKYLMLKLGDKGMITYRSGDSDDPRKFFTLDSFADNVADAVGAGDALLAYATLALSVTRSECVATILGSIAAALSCENDGNLPISPDKVIRRIDMLERRITYSGPERRA